MVLGQRLMIVNMLMGTLSIHACNCIPDSTPSQPDAVVNPNDDGDTTSCAPPSDPFYNGYVPTPEDRLEFYYHYNRWNLTCCKGDALLSSRTQDYVDEHPDYDAIVNMGVRALPLIFEAMMEDGEYFLNSAVERITNVDDVFIALDYDPYEMIRAGDMGEQARMLGWLRWWNAVKLEPDWYPCPNSPIPPPPSRPPPAQCVSDMPVRELGKWFFDNVDYYSNLSFHAIDPTCSGHMNYAVWREGGRPIREAWDYDEDGYDDLVWVHHAEHSERYIYARMGRDVIQRVEVREIESYLRITVDSFVERPAQRIVYQQPTGYEYLEAGTINAMIYVDVDNNGSFGSGPFHVTIPAFHELQIDVDPRSDPGEGDSVCDRPDDVKYWFEEAVVKGRECLSDLDGRLAESLNQMAAGNIWRIRCEDMDAVGRIPERTFHLAGAPAQMSYELVLLISHDFDSRNGFIAAGSFFHELMHLVL